jgi:hypothetical protein
MLFLTIITQMIYCTSLIDNLQHFFELLKDQMEIVSRMVNW